MQGNVFRYNSAMKILPIKNPRAFTLIELLVVMIVIGIMAAVSYGGIIGARDHARLNSAVDSVMGMIQSARSYALSDMQLEVSGDTCDAAYYFVSLSASTVSVSAALTPDCPSATKELISEELTEDVAATVSGGETIGYLPPLADPIFDNEQYIELKTGNDLLTKTITVYPVSGLPEVTD